MKKIDEQQINNEAIFAISFLKTLGHIKTWKEVAEAYFDLSGILVTEKEIKTIINKTDLLEASSEKVSILVDKYISQKHINIDYDPTKQVILDNGQVVNFMLNNGSKTVEQAIGISKEDKIKLFDIDLENDDPITQKKKILSKLNEDNNKVLEVLGYNPNQWKVTKINSGAWGIPMKLKLKGGQEVPIIVTSDKINFEVKLIYERDPKEYANNVVNLLDNGIKNLSIGKIDRRFKKRTYEDCLVHQVWNDLHFGGLTYAPDTSFVNWDSKIAAYVVQTIVDYTARMQETDWKSRELYLVINGDMLDIDNYLNKTANFSNHIMQTDGRWDKIVDSYTAIMLWSIYTLAKYFPRLFLDVNEGNHDKQTSKAVSLAMAIFALSKSVKNVKVNVNKTSQLKESAFFYGNHLFLSDHGELKDASLAKNLKAKYQSFSKEHPWINISASHEHNYSVNKLEGDTLVCRYDSLCPISKFEAEKTTLNGKIDTTLTTRLWKKDKRKYVREDNFEFDRKTIWQGEEKEITTTSPTSMEELQKYFYEEGIWTSTRSQEELADILKNIAIKSVKALEKLGIDPRSKDLNQIIDYALTSGVEIPQRLQMEDISFVIKNIDELLCIHNFEEKVKQKIIV